MVKNPESENLDTYYQIYSRTAYPHAAVHRIVYWALDGELEAIAEDESVKHYFQSLIEETNLDVQSAPSILRSMLVSGDAYVRLVRDDKGNIVDYVYRNEQSADEMFKILGYVPRESTGE